MTYSFQKYWGCRNEGPLCGETSSYHKLLFFKAWSRSGYSPAYFAGYQEFSHTDSTYLVRSTSFSSSPLLLWPLTIMFDWALSIILLILLPFYYSSPPPPPSFFPHHLCILSAVNYSHSVVSKVLCKSAAVYVYRYLHSAVWWFLPSDFQWWTCMIPSVTALTECWAHFEFWTTSRPYSHR